MHRHVASMKTLVVASQKGGVGKTTLSLNLGLAFSEAGYRTLLVDTDPQGAIGLSLSRALTVRPGVADVVAGEVLLTEAIVRTKVDGFALLPVGRIAPNEVHGFSTALSDGRRLHAMLREVEHDYDLALIDTPCGFGGITVGCLRACTHVISPIQAEPIALRSITQLLEMIKSLADEGVVARVVGFVITMLQNRDERSLAVAKDVWEMFPRDLLFDASVPRDPVFLEATSAGVPVGLLRRPAPPVTHVFELIAADVAQRMELPPTRMSDGPLSLVD